MQQYILPRCYALQCPVLAHNYSKLSNNNDDILYYILQYLILQRLNRSLETMSLLKRWRISNRLAFLDRTNERFGLVNVSVLFADPRRALKGALSLAAHLTATPQKHFVGAFEEPLNRL